MKFRPIHLLIILILLTAIAGSILFFYIKTVIATGMPSLEQLENPKQNLATQVISADGKVLDHIFSKEQRVPLKYDSIPEPFIDALIATEDRVFWDHWGVHVERIAKAVVKRVLFGQRAGASTITQQLSRNLFLDQSPTIERKLREAAVAVQIEERYTKEQILEMYANTVHFGKGAFGLQVASNLYFNKEPKQLTIAECAMLVGILPRPAAFNPINDYDAALYKRNLVLRLMHDQDFISRTTFLEEVEKPIEVYYEEGEKDQNTRRQLGENIAPHFVEMIRQELSKNSYRDDFNIYRDGLTIYTTLNSTIQKYANAAVEEHLTDLQADFNQRWSWSRGENPELLKTLIDEAIKDRPDYKKANLDDQKEIYKKLSTKKAFIDSVKNAATTIQCGLVVLDPKIGKILALVGASPKFMEESATAKYSLNHVTQIRRQPGSAFKPFVYAAALNNGLLPSDTIECGPFEYELPSGDIWAPRGTGSCEEGDFRTVESALQWSINTVAARLITSITNPQEVRAIIMRAGVDSPIVPVPALSLGAGGDVKPIELTSAISSFVNNGIHANHYFIEFVEDNKGNKIIERSRSQSGLTDVVSPEIASQITYMLEKVANAGTAGRTRSYMPNIDVDIAGKTGTTNDAADAWFVGFTPQLVAGIWVGFDDKRITFDPLGSEGYGGRAAAPIWGILMNMIYSDQTLGFIQKRFQYKLDQEEDTDLLPYKLTRTQMDYYTNKKSLNINRDSIKIETSKPKSILPKLPLRNQNK
jgi:penicillin-binding protein 1A